MKTKNNYNLSYSILNSLKTCTLCPRACKSNRFEKASGYCKSGTLCGIGAICLHKGEEPVISGKNGICNVFFSKCNMQCVYCQNYQISRNDNKCIEKIYSIEEVVELIIPYLKDGVKTIGFVSPSHYATHVKLIVEIINNKGYKPIIVYNSNAYDNIETLKILENIIDIYLPDFKYANDNLAKKLSDTLNYTKTALNAIREMYRQKGNVLHLNKEHQATSGLIIRHLVLPGYINNSINVLKLIAEEISTNVTISLMAQYNPINKNIKYKSLNRKLLLQEYDKVVSMLYKLGFNKGWIQDLNSSDYYNPDFSNNDPFNNNY